MSYVLCSRILKNPTEIKLAAHIINEETLHRECIKKRSYSGENFKSVKVLFISCDEVNSAQE